MRNGNSDSPVKLSQTFESRGYACIYPAAQQSNGVPLTTLSRRRDHQDNPDALRPVHLQVAGLFLFRDDSPQNHQSHALALITPQTHRTVPCYAHKNGDKLGVLPPRRKGKAVSIVRNVVFTEVDDFKLVPIDIGRFDFRWVIRNLLC